MNNFDDLFEQQPQAEAAPQKQESQKERPKRQWWQIREEKQRKEAYATLDRIFGEFSEGTGSMEAYLDVQRVLRGYGQYGGISGCAEPFSLPLCSQCTSDWG